VSHSCVPISQQGCWYHYWVRLGLSSKVSDSILCWKILEKVCIIDAVTPDQSGRRVRWHVYFLYRVLAFDVDFAKYEMIPIYTNGTRRMVVL
jgi:hypothetical protein